MDVKLLRKSLKETQQQFATRLGVSISTVANWENGSVIPASKMPILNTLAESIGTISTPIETTVKERITSYCKYKQISKSQFCRKIGVSATYIGSMRKSMQPDKIKSIAVNFPDLNVDWLLTGNGKMLHDGIIQNVTGGSNFSQTGNINVNNSLTIEKAIDEISEQRKLTAKSQEQLSMAQNQINRLITLLENKYIAD